MSYIYGPKNDIEKKLVEEYDKLNKEKYKDMYCNMDAHQVIENILNEDLFIRVCIKDRRLKYKVTCIGLAIVSIFICLFLGFSIYNTSNLPLKCLFSFGILLLILLLSFKIEEINFNYKQHNLIYFSALKILDDMKNNPECAKIEKDMF
ncbi:hypothetical protein ACTPDI_17735 [Clostridioides difficile]|uniref:hypothetical protein n=1 Tax=Clostridioides sp. ZZV15-6598 TaxID=2811501 RepID=UPI001D11172E|nr:hypothetical protein [Clostridioides sp. ZZV15-6598]